MKRFLVTFDESESPIDPQAALRALQGVVEIASVSLEQIEFNELSRPGPALSGEAIEKLAVKMEDDKDFLNEPESEAYLGKLKSVWRKPMP